MKWEKLVGPDYTINYGKVMFQEEDAKFVGYTEPCFRIGEIYSKYAISKGRKESSYRLRMIVLVDYGEDHWRNLSFGERYDIENIDVRKFRTLKEAKAYAEAIERGEIEIVVMEEGTQRQVHCKY